MPIDSTPTNTKASGFIDFFTMQRRWEGSRTLPKRNTTIFSLRSGFVSYLSTSKPDITHFFHLGLLSASAIDVCLELGVPMVMTPTDFWLICPNNQLRLPDNSLCRGPDRDSVNCMKHAVANNQPPNVARIFNRSAPHCGCTNDLGNQPWCIFWIMVLTDGTSTSPASRFSQGADEPLG